MTFEPSDASGSELASNAADAALTDDVVRIVRVHVPSPIRTTAWHSVRPFSF